MNKCRIEIKVTGYVAGKWCLCHFEKTHDELCEADAMALVKLMAQCKPPRYPIGTFSMSLSKDEQWHLFHNSRVPTMEGRWNATLNEVFIYENDEQVWSTLCHDATLAAQLADDYLAKIAVTMPVTVADVNDAIDRALDSGDNPIIIEREQAPE